MRLFVAIAPPSAVLDELDAEVEPFRARRLDLRWTNREAWHVTLAFLGQVDETATAGLLPRLEHAAQRHQQIRLAFAGAGAFPSAERANVLWSGISGDCEALAGWPSPSPPAPAGAGASPPDRGRRFQPHLTLARCRIAADVTGLVAALDPYQGQLWTADRLHLVRSRAGLDRVTRGTSRWPAGRCGHRRRSAINQAARQASRARQARTARPQRSRTG